ncbi:MAG: hypothetical protein NZ700_12860 [Gemmataceae bacterium]|nr:hypothetical protein [Gemmataceae bacterium]MDW8266328.1 GTP-binding protein [Gemmataceae bacterium]
MLDDLLARFRQKDRRALARLVSLVARGDAPPSLWERLGPAPGPSRVVALTGSAGVGKSSLTGRLIETLRRRGLTVAVLACDPQSPISGGALLGDRLRMPSHPDDGLFIRSLATEGGHGAVAPRLADLIRLVEAFGFDIILVETVGAGQGDTAIHGLADVVVLLLQPETGDDIQWEKAGILEIADVFVIHKADLPGAERLEADVRANLRLLHPQPPPVLRVSAKTGEGIEPLWEAIAACPRRRTAAAADRGLLRHAQELLAEWFAAAARRHDPHLEELLAQWRHGGHQAGDAVGRLLAQAAAELMAIPRPERSAESLAATSPDGSASPAPSSHPAVPSPPHP